MMEAAEEVGAVAHVAAVEHNRNVGEPMLRGCESRNGTLLERR